MSYIFGLDNLYILSCFVFTLLSLEEFCSLTMTTSSIFDILRTKMLTLTTAGPSNDKTIHEENFEKTFSFFRYNSFCCFHWKVISTCFVSFIYFGNIPKLFPFFFSDVCCKNTEKKLVAKLSTRNDVYVRVSSYSSTSFYCQIVYIFIVHCSFTESLKWYFYWFLMSEEEGTRR